MRVTARRVMVRAMSSMRLPGIFAAVTLSLSLTACVASSGPAPTGTTTPPTTTPPREVPPVATPSFLSADGRTVASERTYKGDCAPAGTRGGCHTITLRPDGTYRNFLYDAAIEGKYEISNSTVHLAGPAPDSDQHLALAADGSMLGDMAYEPAQTQTAP